MFRMMMRMSIIVLRLTSSAVPASAALSLSEVSPSVTNQSSLKLLQQILWSFMSVKCKENKNVIKTDKM